MIPQQSTGYLCALLLYPCLSYTVSGEDACPCVTGSNCPENCTLVNIAPQARSSFTSRDNNAYTIIGQAAWVTDGVTSGPCASVSSLYPAWKAEFGQNRTISRIKIFWEGPQNDVTVSLGGRVCHSADSSYTWMSEYTLICEISVTGDNLLMHRQPTGHSLNLSLCEVEIYALPSTSSFVSTTSLRSTTSSTTSDTSTTSAVSEKISTITVNIAPQARSSFTSRDNNAYTIIGQAAWVTDGVTSGPCASVSSLYPAWKAEFGQTRTVSRIKIFWEGPQNDVTVSVGGRLCHSENSSYTWMSEYTLNCYVPVTGDNLLMFRQPTGHSLNLSLCEVEIYVFTTSAATTTENDQALSTTLNTTYTTQVTTASDTTSTENTAPVTTSSPKISKEITKPATTAPATTTAITPTKITTLITMAAATTTSPITSAGIPTPGPGTAKDDVSSIITPIMVSYVVIVVVLCVTVVIVCYIRRQQSPNHQEENRNQSEKHYAGLESGHGDGDYSSLNCAYEEFPCAP